MDNIKKVYDIINSIAEDPRVDITQIDNLSFNVVIKGELMDSFEKLGEIQKRIEESCSDEYKLKTIYGDAQDAKLILEKN